MNTAKVATLTIIKRYKPELSNLLNILHEVQNNSENNYISEEDVKVIAEYLNTTMAAIQGVVEYYSMFSNSKRGKYIIRLCKSPICRMFGAQDLLLHLQARLGIHVGETDDREIFTLELSECLGHCDKAPVMMINGDLHHSLDNEKIDRIIKEYTLKS